MKVYLEEKDIGRKITTYHDGLGTQQGLYVYGKDKIEVLSLADYTKQVRKEVCQKIRENAISHNNLEVDMYYITPQQLYEIEQGETECQKN